MKLSVLPSDIAKTVKLLGQGSDAVIQANGIGHARIPSDIAQLRGTIEQMGGTLTILRQPTEKPLETWGNPGDAFALMRALKQQFDPKGTLNPGRYVGGI